MKQGIVVYFTCALITTIMFSGRALAENDGQGPDDIPIPQVVQALSGGKTIYKRVVVNDAAQVFPGPADNVYQNLPGAGPDGGAFAAIVGQGTLVTVRFTAESQCAGGGSDVGWCGLQVLVGGIETLPGPNADFAFDSTNSGADGSASWEGHAMERVLCVANPSGATHTVPVQVQWRVFSSDGNTTPPTFRLDDWSLVIESAAASC